MTDKRYSDEGRAENRAEEKWEDILFKQASSTLIRAFRIVKVSQLVLTTNGLLKTRYSTCLDR